MEKGSAWFDLTTNSPTLVRRLHQLCKERGLHLPDAPVSGGPQGAKSGRLAIWVGGEEAIFAAHKQVLDAFSDAARYIGPIGAGSVAKLVHNCAGYGIQMVLAEVFSMGVKAGVEPLALWEAVRSGASGRQRTFDRLYDRFLPNKVRPFKLCPEARTQGHAACHRAGPRAGRANAACQYGIRRDDGGAQPGLGEPRQPITRAAPARTVWPQGRSRSSAAPRGARPRSAAQRRSKARISEHVDRDLVFCV